MGRLKIVTFNIKMDYLLHFFLLAIGMNLIAGVRAQHVPTAPSSANLQIAKQWKLLAYNFQAHAPVDDMNFYNPLNTLITGLAITHDRIFIATPKLFSGVPSTLNFVNKAEFGDSPDLQAYPDWSFSTTARTDFNCSDLVLVSVYRMRIDSCNRLWVLDAGISRSLEDYEKTCPPKILIIDLHTNQVVRRVDFPPEVLRGESLFTNLIVDETTAKAGTCDDVFIYISDTVEPALVVYDSERDVTWRVSHPAMYPDPDFAQSEILNDRFILMDGVVGLSFDEKLGVIYFQPLATDRIFSVAKDVLRAGPLAQNQILQVKLVGKKSSQGIGMTVMPNDGALIFSPMTETAIASWNPTTNKQTVLTYDRDRLQFVADITTSRSEPGVIYAIASKFHRFFLKNLEPKEVNNRILRITLPNAAVPTQTNIVHHHSHPFKHSLVPHFNTFYQTNSIEKHAAPSIQPTAPLFTNYISSSSLVSPKHPYSFDHVSGIINYSLRNPFTALNQGESFPPSRENRNAFQVSYLDSLNGVATVTTHPLLPLNRAYYYDRATRSVAVTPGQETTPAAVA